ncbi:hypothetical protein BDN72DRAFT_734347, partial [Pluteus cervinus]
LHWESFPWPMFKRPMGVEEITSMAVGLYLNNSHYPERSGGGGKGLKDRIKEHIRRWHPDRFETKVLPRVVEDDREKVKEGAGTVVRILNELLR